MTAVAAEPSAKLAPPLAVLPSLTGRGRWSTPLPVVPQPARKRCPDFAAILRATSPDEQIRQQVASCFYEEIRRLAKKRCRDDVMAEDTAQEALIAALEALGSFRGEAPLRAWLRRIVFTACSRMRRGKAKKLGAELSIEELPPDLVPATDDADQEMVTLLHERLELLERVLAETAEPNRSMLLLHEGQDRSVAELAQQFDLSHQAVKARLKRTRSIVRERLLRIAEQEI